MRHNLCNSLEISTLRKSMALRHYSYVEIALVSRASAVPLPGEVTSRASVGFAHTIDDLPKAAPQCLGDPGPLQTARHKACPALGACANSLPGSNLGGQDVRVPASEVARSRSKTWRSGLKAISSGCAILAHFPVSPILVACRWLVGGL